MRLGVPGSIVAALLVLAGCGSSSPAPQGADRSDGGGGRGGGAGASTDASGDVPATGTGGAAGAAVGDGAAGSGGARGDAALDASNDLAPDLAPDAAGSDGAGDARGDGASLDGAEASGGDGAGEPVSMPCLAAGACDPFDPTSCGSKICAVGLDGNTSCVTGAASPKALGAACASREECAGGLDCVTIGTDPAPSCQRMCPRGSIGFCGGEYRCTSFLAGCIQYCRLRDAPCDIYAQDCAGAGLACSLSVDSETGARYTGCRPAGTAARGDSCDDAACGKGLLCVREGSVSTCRQICTGDGGAAPCLAAGETCSGLTSTYQISYCR
ncbi:MAG TPA: hypothetical protein VHL80_08665 [Polyangia bacterium]|nr:hypothetical protein [Polyangia bacterium]